MEWYNRTSALFLKAVLGESNSSNLLMIPIYRRNVVDHIWFDEHPCIWRHYLRDYVREFPDGRGHMNQSGHDKFKIRLAAEIFSRWQIKII